MKAKLLDVTLEEYRSDDVGCKAPTLNSHIAHEIVSKTPLHGQLIHPKMGGMQRSATKAMDKGTIIHACLLHAGRAGIKIIVADNFRTKAAQLERENAVLEGLIPLLEKDAEVIMQAAMTIERKLRDDFDVILDGQSEIPILWQQNGVWCRRCIDHRKNLTVFELKSTASANPEFCARQSVNLGYDISVAATMDALAALEPENAGRFEFKFIFAEIEPPYDLIVVPPSGQFMTLANYRWQKALMAWKEGIETGYWPGYVSPAFLDPPAYSLKELMEEEFV